MREEPKRRTSPRLPWKRGPAAWKVANNAAEVLKHLETSPCRFFSLRGAANILGISPQPLRDWIKREHIKRGGPRSQISKAELSRIVAWFEAKAEPFEMESRSERFHRHADRQPRRFERLRAARFAWPKGRTALTPKELSALIGCHPSLITKAIHAYGLGRRKSPIRRKTVWRERWQNPARTRCRWEITRRAWSNTFFSTLITKPRMPSLPPGELIPVVEVARHLQACGMNGIDQPGVRKLIEDGRIQAVHKTPTGRKWFVPKANLKEFRKNLK
jgi:hypothetical protein